MYDASEGNTEPVGGGTFLALLLFQLFTGIGSEAGYDGALNVVIKSFPDKIVSPKLPNRHMAHLSAVHRGLLLLES